MTFFCTLITSLILICMTCISLYISESSAAGISFASFQSNVTTALGQLENQNLITHQSLLQLRDNYGFMISIYDNGTPLHYNDLGNRDLSDQLLEQIRTISANEFDLDLRHLAATNILSRHAQFPVVSDQGVKYYASTALIPKDTGTLSAILLYSLRSEQNAIIRQRFLFAMVSLAAIIALGIFSWFFTRRMIRPIQESRQRQMNFIAAASHELRSPLTVMLSSLSALKMAEADDSGLFIDIIHSEGQRMSRLINDMLTLANADNESWSISPQEIQLTTLLLQTYEKYAPIARQKQLSLSFDIPTQGVPGCVCDSQRITQVLSILTDNAFSYTPAGGKVAMTLRAEPGWAVIQVIDNGPGISAENKSLIFERFYRADKAHQSKSHFGLGLCIAQEIVRLHQGQLTVHDTPGGGATFRLALPLV